MSTISQTEVLLDILSCIVSAMANKLASTTNIAEVLSGFGIASWEDFSKPMLKAGVSVERGEALFPKLDEVRGAGGPAIL